MVAYNDDDELDILGKGDVLDGQEKAQFPKNTRKSAKKPAEHLDIQFIYPGKVI